MVALSFVLASATLSFHVQASPIDLAKRADEALSQVKGLAFSGTFTRQTGPASGQFDKKIVAKCAVVVEKNQNEKVMGWKMSVSSVLEGQTHPIGAVVNFVFDGKDLTTIQPEFKRAIRIKEYDQPLTSDLRYWAFPTTFCATKQDRRPQQDPFMSLVKEADSSTTLPTKIVNGVPCVGFRLEYQSKQAEFKPGPNDYYFGDKDFILRQISTEFTLGPTKFADTTDLVNLVVNPYIGEDSFRLDTPTGYTETVQHWPTFLKEMAEREKNAAKGPDAGVTAPDFKLVGTDGKQHSLSEFRGKVVLLDFYGTWCGPCNAAMPHHKKLYETLDPKKFALVGVSCQEQPTTNVKKYMLDRGCKYLVLLKGESAAATYSVSAYPTYLIIDRDGKIAYRQSGYDEEIGKKMAAVLQKLISK